MIRLRLLSFFRMVFLHLPEWLALSMVYLAAATFLLEPVWPKLMGYELAKSKIALLLILMITLPLAVERMLQNLPQIGVFKGSLLRAEFVVLYLQQQLRKPQTWLTIGLVSLLCVGLPERHFATSILIFQLLLQRELYGVHLWRSVVMMLRPKTGGVNLVDAVLCSQLLQFGIVAIGLGFALSWSGSWVQVLVPLCATAIGGAAVALEGDSGRPFLVNLFSITTATLSGLLCFASPWVVLIVIYGYFQIRSLAAARLISVENLQEDDLVS